MMNNIVISKGQTIRIKSIITALGIVACVTLPQIFHLAGVLLGVGNVIGAALLPMHLPVMLVGLLSGGPAGFLCGALSPAVSFALTGMPTAALVPFMSVELAAYGLAAGLLNRTKMHIALKILIAQLTGRAMRSAAVLMMVYVVGSDSVGISQAWNYLITGLPGMAVQLCLLPLLMKWVDGIHE